jgi:hypothetical protein
VAIDSNSLPTAWSPAANLAWKTPLPGPGASSPIIMSRNKLEHVHPVYIGTDGASVPRVVTAEFFFNFFDKKKIHIFIFFEKNKQKNILLIFFLLFFQHVKVRCSN